MRKRKTSSKAINFINLWVNFHLRSLLETYESFKATENTHSCLSDVVRERLLTFLCFGEKCEIKSRLADSLTWSWEIYWVWGDDFVAQNQSSCQKFFLQLPLHNRSLSVSLSIIDWKAIHKPDQGCHPCENFLCSQILALQNSATKCQEFKRREWNRKICSLKTFLSDDIAQIFNVCRKLKLKRCQEKTFAQKTIEKVKFYGASCWAFKCGTIFYLRPWDSIQCCANFFFSFPSMRRKNPKFSLRYKS